MSSLASIILEKSRPLEPDPTGESADLTRLDGIRSVIFDIYGTLFISAAGDISLADETSREGAVREAIESVGLHLKPDAAGLSRIYRKHIRAAQKDRGAEGIEYPEVEIREVWMSLLAELAGKEWLTGDFEGADTIEALAMTYECSVNPVWPMPGLAETLLDLKDCGLPLGILSNAQFFTLPLFPAFLDEEIEALGFAPDLQIYSFREREGKPSRRLFEILAEKLSARGIDAGQALYVGNDMRNDIWPAQALGFRTALFAGDLRSLRWRKGDARVAEVVPDLVITDLRELLEVVN